ncbi:acetyltransferase [Arthrobacter alpinus]|uniref:Acetyltransferase n=1 Tax=Arthrobacter alpinus TaxID=656366 RepID=A0A0S2LVT6_9MICC|nr:GNAT family N-acetyltransferase [Arthrobacter alpinus]ALO65636.1 acetyltransferase [Arthrobacter alpinus]
MDQESNITVRQNADRHRYELVDGERVIGKAHWLTFERDASQERIFFHTTVDEEYAGQGLAGKLAHFALEDTIAAGLKVVPVCPYFKVYLRKHPEYKEHTVMVEQAHLDAVTAAV